MKKIFDAIILSAATLNAIQLSYHWMWKGDKTVPSFIFYGCFMSLLFVMERYTDKVFFKKD